MKHKLSAGIIVVLLIAVTAGFMSQNQEPEEIIIPLYVHRVDDGTVQYATNRDVANIVAVVEEANRIWEQGNIRFIVEDIDTILIENHDFSEVLGGDLTVLLEGETFQPGKMNVYFSRYLAANGVAFPAQGLVFVADITSVHDYRTAAHELGHLLGLTHVEERDYLMFQGSNGEFLSQAEIEFARANALRVYA